MIIQTRSEELIPSAAARVWRGFRAKSLPVEEFYKRLGAVFIPATVEMQVHAGLCAYIPTVTASLPGKPDTVPDETAILFWDSQQTYRDAFDTLAVRTYTLTHESVYTPASGAGFPSLFAGTVEADQPYHLLEESADWMNDAVLHLIGSRPDDLPSETFRTRVARALGRTPTSSLKGAIACTGDDYLVYWQLGDDHGQTTAELRRSLDWSHQFTATPTTLPAGLWDTWPGMTVKPGDSLNMHFRRRWE